MKIVLTKDFEKPNGKKIKKGTVIDVTNGHPYKHSKPYDKDDSKDTQEEVKETTINNNN